MKIYCLGIDYKIHRCYPWKDETICGVKIKRKKLLKNDFINYFGCYECTY